MRNQNKKTKNFRIRDFDPQMHDKSIIATTFLISLLATIFLFNTFKLILLDPVFAQVKGGLSSSVNPNSTIGERTGNTTADLNTGGTSAASVTDGLAMTMSSSGKTGNSTNHTQGGISASSVNETGEK